MLHRKTEGGKPEHEDEREEQGPGAKPRGLRCRLPRNQHSTIVPETMFAKEFMHHFVADRTTSPCNGVSGRDRTRLPFAPYS